jgi:hypothetical protein
MTIQLEVILFWNRPSRRYLDRLRDERGVAARPPKQLARMLRFNRCSTLPVAPRHRTGPASECGHAGHGGLTRVAEFADPLARGGSAMKLWRLSRSLDERGRQNR